MERQNNKNLEDLLLILKYFRIFVYIRKSDNKILTDMSYIYDSTIIVVIL